MTSYSFLLPSYLCVSKQTVSTPHEEMRLILIPCACTQISPRNISTVLPVRFLVSGTYRLVACSIHQEHDNKSQIIYNETFFS